MPSFTLQKLNLGFPWYQKNENNPGLVGVITSSVYVTFARTCFVFVNICQKKREKEKRIKMGFGFHSGAIHVHV